MARACVFLIEKILTNELVCSIDLFLGKRLTFEAVLIQYYYANFWLKGDIFHKYRREQFCSCFPGVTAAPGAYIESKGGGRVVRNKG